MYVEIVHVQPTEIMPQISHMHSLTMCGYQLFGEGVKYKTSVIAIPKSPLNVRIPHFTKDADQARAYSALEVVSCQRAYQESQLEISQSSAEGKEVAPDGGKQYILYGLDGVKVITKGGRFTHEHGDHHGDDRLYVRWTPKKKWVLGGAFGLIVLLAVVLGSVLGSSHKQSATASLTNPQNSTSPSNSSTTTPLPYHTILDIWSIPTGTSKIPPQKPATSQP